MLKNKTLLIENFSYSRQKPAEITGLSLAELMIWTSIRSTSDFITPGNESMTSQNNEVQKIKQIIGPK